MAAREIATGEQGKGQSVWVALGYLFGRDESDVIALHDCDIVTYDRLLLARLIEPVANPNNDFQFCKGYYARISPNDRAMKGRATRLFVTPFVDTLSQVMCQRGHSELERFFLYHRAFKYPLAGEFCFTSDLARGLNVAYDWGLEVATLSQVYDQLTARQIAQIDLAANYEHKHQDLAPDDTDRGLHRMVVDIGKFYLTYMRSHGIPLDDSFVDMVLHTYYQKALKYIRKYSYDADVNGLAFDLYEEETAAGHFRGFLWDAWMQSKGPQEAKLIPSWNRVAYVFPEIYDRLLGAVEQDNAAE
jgi:glucosyl-3-phosphoglycerate synthase